MVNSTEFAKRLQKILEYYGLSATALSEKLAFNRSTISHLLSGRNKPSLEFVMKVLNEFPEVELYWLLNGTGNFPALPKSENSVSKKMEADLFSEKSEIIKEAPISQKLDSKQEIDRIVIFYKDGSFKSYES